MAFRLTGQGQGRGRGQNGRRRLCQDTLWGGGGGKRHPPQSNGGSGGGNREELDRSCWDWVDDVDDPKCDPIGEDMVSRAYRLHYPMHTYPDQSCKRNCKFNPKCYCGQCT